MEMVAYLAGEDHSDKPECTCPVIAAFVRRLNDAMPNDDIRTSLLLPLVPKLVGTRSTPEIELRRAFIAADWAVRVAAPTALRSAGLDEEAQTLELLPAVVDRTTALTAWAAALASEAAAEAAAEADWAAAMAATWAAKAAASRASAKAAAAAASAARAGVYESAIQLTDRMIAAAGGELK
jgi:hypothetical protein